MTGLGKMASTLVHSTYTQKLRECVHVYNYVCEAVCGLNKEKLVCSCFIERHLLSLVWFGIHITVILFLHG